MPFSPSRAANDRAANPAWQQQSTKSGRNDPRIGTTFERAQQARLIIPPQEKQATHCLFTETQALPGSRGPPTLPTRRPGTPDSTDPMSPNRLPHRRRRHAPKGKRGSEPDGRPHAEAVASIRRSPRKNRTCGHVARIGRHPPSHCPVSEEAANFSQKHTEKGSHR